MEEKLEHLIDRYQQHMKLHRMKTNVGTLETECGLFWGCFEYGAGKQKNKRTLVLDSEEYRYQASLSDIAGQDIQIHNNDPRVAVDKVGSWLNAGSGRSTIPGGRAIWEHYVLFQRELTPMLRRVGITRVELDTPEYYPDYVNFVVEWLIEQEEKAARRQR